jgi:hypothetical protein
VRERNSENSEKKKKTLGSFSLLSFFLDTRENKGAKSVLVVSLANKQTNKQKQQKNEVIMEPHARV